LKENGWPVSWSEVLALRKRGEKQASDQRILGDSNFVKDVISGLDELAKRNLRLSGRQVDIDELALSACEKHNISLTELRSGSRRHEIVEVRRIVSWIAVRELGYSDADVSRYLGVTTSCVNRSVSSGKRPKLEEYIK
jgi:putative transposase